jgi:hypothetical protein
MFRVRNLSIINSNNGYVLSGFKYHHDDSGYKVGFVSKTDLNGDVQWIFETSEQAIITSVIENRQDQYSAIGHFFKDRHEVVLYKLDNGKLISKSLLNFNTDFTIPIEQVPVSADSTYIFGYFEESGEQEEAFVALLNDTVIKWQKAHGGEKSERFIRSSHSQKSFYVIGSTNSESGNQLSHWNFWILKLDYGGDTLWTHKYGTTKWDRSLDILAIDRGAIAVGSIGDRDNLAILKMDESGFIDKAKNELIISIGAIGLESKVHIYPNPFEDKLNIETGLSPTDIKIYNMLGQVVYIGSLNHGIHSVPLAHLPNGSYILSAVSEEHQVCKMLVKR